jgi:hypothetical protein
MIEITIATDDNGLTVEEDTLAVTVPTDDNSVTIEEE